MNFWASSNVDTAKLNFKSPKGNPLGRLWMPADGKASSAILLVETYAFTGNLYGGWVTPAAVGFAGNTPGARFGGGIGISPQVSVGRFGKVSSEIAWYRHRRGPGLLNASFGRANFAYMDGHVAMKSNTELADPASGISTLNSYWSPIDQDINQ